MKTKISLAILLCSLLLIPAVTQSRDPATELANCENQLLTLIAQKEAIINAAAERNGELKRLRNLATRANNPNERSRIESDINVLLNQDRNTQIELARIEIQAERTRIQIDQIHRSFLLGGAPGRPGRPGWGANPQIQSIKILKFFRQGPVRVTGKGIGYWDTNVFEVTYANGQKQQVEDKAFTPQRSAR
ncbi:MAG: hypothetical protein AAGC68_00680 [Verrucomicrobiota bacterium]